MAKATVSDDEFIRLWRALGSGMRVAKHLGINERPCNARRRRLEAKLDISLDTVDAMGRTRFASKGTRPASERLELTLQDGYLIAFSDAHYWPGEPTKAHEALLNVVKKLKPRIVVANGDVFDGARISRHPPLGWEQAPAVLDEMKAVQQRLAEVVRAGKGAQFIRTIGNHDIRFERHLATVAPEFRGIEGFKLSDHLRDWQECMSVLVNGDVMVKHRWHNGIHAAYNNTVKAGLSLVTGHLHSLQVRPWTDYNGTRYGVDTGTLSEPFSDQFAYAEDNPRNWRSGFAVLKFVDGRLLPPEVCEVARGAAWFRGEQVA